MLADIILDRFIYLIGALFLITACFRPYFIKPRTNMKTYNYIIQHKKGINIAGRIFTLCYCIAITAFIIIPACKDCILYFNNEFEYLIVESKYDYDISSTAAKKGFMNVFYYPSLDYDVEKGMIICIDEDCSVGQLSTSINLNYSHYEQGDFYLIRYLPNTNTGEVMMQIPKEDIELLIRNQ